MSVLEELIQERFKTSLQMTRDRYISMCIIQAYYREHDYDKSIHDCFNYHQELIDITSSNHRWEPSKDGYKTRTNFRYDTNKGEIVFTTHRITRGEDRYISDGSDISNKQLNDHIGDFAALVKAEQIIYGYYLKDKEIIDKLVAAVPMYNKTDPTIIENRIEVETEDNKLFYTAYGTIGKELLIKWLNRLSDEETDIIELISDLKNDLLTAKLYLEAEDKPDYRRVKNIDFEEFFLRMLVRYSPRGEYLRSTYRKSIGEQVKRKTV